MAYEVGRLLLALAQADAPLTVAELADRTGMDESFARLGTREMLETGSLTRARTARRPTRDGSTRWAHGYELGPEREVRGPGRRPRLVPLALLVNADLACGDYVDVVLRRAGLLTAQVTDPAEAHGLLAYIGFDLVMVDTASCLPPPGTRSLGAAMRAAGCTYTALLECDRDAAAEPSQALGAHTTLRKPFTPEQLLHLLAQLGVGTLDYGQLARSSAS